MKRVLYSRVAGRDVHLPKMVGAFIIVATLLMFLQSASSLFDARDVMVYYQDCVLDLSKNENISDQRSQFEFCAQALYNATGLVVKDSSPLLTTRQYIIGLSEKVAVLLFWLAVLIAGYFLYRTDRLIFPLEGELVDSKSKKFAFKKK